jgi:hypothetical protein
LLGDTGQPSHLLLPEVDLILRPSILVVSASSLRLVESVLDLSRPLFEQGLEVVNHVVDLLSLGVTAFEKLLDLWLKSLGVLLQLDVVVDRLQGFSQFVGELVEDLAKLLLGILLAEFPVGLGEVLDHRFEALVDGSIQSSDGVLRNFTEKDGVVVVGIDVDWLVINDIGA